MALYRGTTSTEGLRMKVRVPVKRPTGRAFSEDELCGQDEKLEGLQ